MNKAAQFANELESIEDITFTDVIETHCQKALFFDNIKDALLIMYDDGSVIIIELQSQGIVTSEVISAANILKVLYHYRPFAKVFKK